MITDVKNGCGAAWGEVGSETGEETTFSGEIVAVELNGYAMETRRRYF
jgi:hypothetical protein